jgi:Domain of unknown function (DUF4375)
MDAKNDADPSVLVFGTYEAACKKIGDPKDFATWERRVKSLPHALRIVYTTMSLDNQVNNGGFHQYFWNPGGIFAEKAVEDFRALGDSRRAQIVERAMHILLEEKEMQLAARKKNSLKSFSEAAKVSKLEEVTNEYYEIDDDDPLYERLNAFIRENSASL